MIGGAASNPSYQSNYQNSETTLNSGLYSRLFPVGLTLAVSKDMVCRTLFDKLMLQIVHWFSGNGHVPPADMNALLDALVDGISKDSDSELRDFSAKLIAEFFRWSIKQSSGSEMKKGISNSPCELLLTRILVLVAHPLPDYRSGGVSVCNKIYTPLRDEVPLVERYVLQIIFSLLQAIRFGDTKNAEQALHRYIQILVKSVQRSNGEIGIVLHSRFLIYYDMILKWYLLIKLCVGMNLIRYLLKNRTILVAQKLFHNC